MAFHTMRDLCTRFSCERHHLSGRRRLYSDSQLHQIAESLALSVARRPRNPSFTYRPPDSLE